MEEDTKKYEKFIWSPYIKVAIPVSCEDAPAISIVVLERCGAEEEAYLSSDESEMRYMVHLHFSVRHLQRVATYT